MKLQQHPFGGAYCILTEQVFYFSSIFVCCSYYTVNNVITKNLFIINNTMVTCVLSMAISGHWKTKNHIFFKNIACTE